MFVLSMATSKDPRSQGGILKIGFKFHRNTKVADICIVVIYVIVITCNYTVRLELNCIYNYFIFRHTTRH